jgi:hypothetical protein
MVLTRLGGRAGKPVEDPDVRTNRVGLLSGLGPARQDMSLLTGINFR